MTLGLPGIQSTLHPAGPQAQRILDLFDVFLIVTTVVFVIVVVLTVAAVVKGRRRREAIGEDTRGMKLAVGTGAVLTIAALITLLVTSVATGRAVGTFGGGNPDQMEIVVTGHQWWWEVTYPDPQASNTVRTANEIHIPTGQPILLRLATRDVIHSLWIPRLHGKRDLIPGRINKIYIQADAPGVFRAQCAEFCGLQHAHMSLVVIAQTPGDFMQWKIHQQAPANDPATPQQAHGRELFLDLPCINCHAVTGTDAYATLGPDLTHVASRKTLAAGTLINNHGNLAGWVSNAAAIKPGAQMPPIPMNGPELQDLLAYLENLK
ncbi:MAG TPA: cytochrome c oxidase subunit II [Thermoanaerobaculia bacterium]|jgi:cytochrome c oxidase subunit 2|nr:cytochrome c oxidase subunit II [Thermoanaerobaculia bacterium]